MIFKRKKYPIDTLQITITWRLQKIQNFQVWHFKIILKWDTHIRTLTNKLHNNASIIYLTRNFLDKNSLKLLIYSLFVYANIIWGKSRNKHIKPLIIAQKRIVQTIMNRSRFHHTNTDFYNLGFLKFRDIVSYFASLLKRAGNEHNHNLRYSQKHSH